MKGELLQEFYSVHIFMSCEVSEASISSSLEFRVYAMMLLLIAGKYDVRLRDFLHWHNIHASFCENRSSI
jgi:hypothetical protein